MKLYYAVFAFSSLISSFAYAADPPPLPTGGDSVTTSPPHQPVCNAPDDASVTLNVKRGEVATVMALLNGQENNVSIGAVRVLANSINSQLATLSAKYCK